MFTRLVAGAAAAVVAAAFIATAVIGVVGGGGAGAVGGYSRAADDASHRALWLALPATMKAHACQSDLTGVDTDGAFVFVFDACPDASKDADGDN